MTVVIFRITNTWTWTLIYAVGIVNAKAIYTNLIYRFMNYSEIF